MNKDFLSCFGKFVSAVGNRGGFHHMPDDIYLRIIFRAHVGYKLNLANPETFNEKLQWLKIHNRKDIYTTMVDKLNVRNYLSSLIGEGYSVPLLGVWNRFDDIDFDLLPDQFVLKCTHDSGSVIICKDKSTFNYKQAKKKLSHHLKQNLYYGGREWPYKNVPPRIIAEEFITEMSGEEIKDYKLFCFNGKVKCLKIDFNRSINHRANYYDRDFRYLPISEKVCPTDPDKHFPRPEKLDEMIDLAEKLSADIPFLRVDFYCVDARIYIGELTFYPAGGIEKISPMEWDITLGNWIDLKGV